MLKNLRLFIILLLPVAINAQSFSGKQKVMDPNRSTFSFMGSTVEMANDYAFVAAPESPYDTAGTNPLGQSGVVLVYKRNPAGRWSLFQKLQSSSRNNGGQFGWSMAAEDSILVVGARGERLGLLSGGAIHVFRLQANGRWHHEQRLIPSDTAFQGRFGESVAISYPHIIAGAEKNDLDSANSNALFDAGAAYVFEKTGGQWQQVDKLSASQGRVSSAYFGRSVAIDGTRILVGAPRGIVPAPGGSNFGFGGVYEYQRQSTGKWNEVSILTDTLGGSLGGDFGHRVALADSLAFISAVFRSYDTVSSCGEVIVMQKQSGGWMSMDHIRPLFPFDNDRFGTSIDLDGYSLIVGADSEDHDLINQNSITSAGSAFWFEWDPASQSMVFKQKILPQDRILPNSTFDFFGSDVAIDNGLLLIGARNDDDDTANVTQTNAAGTAYFFDTTCTPLSGSFSASICAGDSILFDGQYLKNGGSYTALLSAQNGCDSIVLLTLNTLAVPQDSISVTACDSYTLPSGTRTVISSGNYVDTLLSAGGCDSLLYIDLSLNQSSTTSLIDTGCGSYLLPGSLNLITASGQYFDTLQTASGCDSILDFNLTIVNVDTAVLLDQANQQLIALATNATFRWLDCENNLAVIPGIVDDTAGFQPGTYAVEITQNGCVDTSRCVVLRPTATAFPVNDPYFEIYPNPSMGDFMIVHHSSMHLSKLEIYNTVGSLITEFDQPRMNRKYALNFPPGTYFALAYTSDGEVISQSISLAKP